MDIYSVDEAFELLESYKITTNKESVRRWLRQGVIKGIAPVSKKEGWKITQKALDDFIRSRLPNRYTTNVAKKEKKLDTTSDVKEVEEWIRTDIWMELAKKNIWEGYVELKKRRVHECIQHRRYSKELEVAVWQACEENNQGYSKPRVFYLLDAFKFKGKRILLDKNFESLEEQVIFAIIEHVRSNGTYTGK